MMKIWKMIASNKCITTLFTHCLVARKEDACKNFHIEGFTEIEYGMVTMENVKNVLFQALLFDNIDRDNENWRLILFPFFIKMNVK